MGTLGSEFALIQVIGLEEVDRFVGREASLRNIVFFDQRHRVETDSYWNSELELEQKQENYRSRSVHTTQTSRIVRVDGAENGKRETTYRPWSCKAKLLA